MAEKYNNRRSTSEDQDLKKIQADIDKEKAKQAKEKEMKRNTRWNTAKNVLLVILSLVVTCYLAYSYGKSEGYKNKSDEQARINQEAAKLVEQLKSRK